MNPLDWSGPAFLELFLLLWVLSLLGASFLRWWLRQPGSTTDNGIPPLGPYEAALLRGSKALIEAALASLAHRGFIRMAVDRLVTAGPIPFAAPLIERIVYTSVAEGRLSNSELVQTAEPAIQQLRAPLVRRGWLLDDTWAVRARWLPMLPLLAVLLMGFAKLAVGMERDKPVGFLLITCGLVLFAVFRAARTPWRSRRGDAVLRALRDEQAALRQTARGATSASALNPQDMAMAVGLFGLSAVGYTEFELMRRHLHSSGYTSSGASFGGDGIWDSGGGGCGGGDSGGGDSGGGDGGGGGGCGGCGGGD